MFEKLFEESWQDVDKIDGYVGTACFVAFLVTLGVAIWSDSVPYMVSELIFGLSSVIVVIGLPLLSIRESFSFWMRSVVYRKELLSSSESVHVQYELQPIPFYLGLILVILMFFGIFGAYRMIKGVVYKIHTSL